MYQLKYIKYKTKYLELKQQNYNTQKYNTQNGGQKEVSFINIKTKAVLKFIYPNETYNTNITRFVIEMNKLDPTTYVKFFNISYNIELALKSKKEIYYSIITTLSPNTEILNAINNYFNYLNSNQLTDDTLYLISMFSYNLDPTNHIRNITQQLPLNYVVYSLQHHIPLHIILVDMAFIPELNKLNELNKLPTTATTSTTTSTTTITNPIIDEEQNVQQVYDYLKMEKRIIASYDDLYIAEFTKNPSIILDPQNIYIKTITDELHNLGFDLNDLQIKVTVIGIELADYGNKTFIKMAEKIEALQKFINKKKVIVQAFDGTVYEYYNFDKVI